MSHAVVIGGGIGGLTAAAALSQAGWTVTVCERAPSLEPVGSGIAIAPNALAALDTIGIGDDVRELSAWQGEAGIRRSDGRWLVRTSAEAARSRFGDPTVLLLRTTLIDLIAGRVPSGSLRLGTTVHSVDPAEGRVSTSSGDLTADLVVAADGIHSPTRRSLFPTHPGPVHSGVTSWRAIIPWPSARTLTGGESWGRGSVFGIMPLTGDQVYCYATAPASPSTSAPQPPADTQVAPADAPPPATPTSSPATPTSSAGAPPGAPTSPPDAPTSPPDAPTSSPGAPTSPPGAPRRAAPPGDGAAEKAELLRLFGGWHAPIPDLLAAAPEDRILRLDLHALANPLPALHKDRVVLLGDAAHAMTPNLSQGACQAIEDAVVLAAVAEKHGPAAYTEARLSRTSAIMRRSWSICRLTSWTNPLAVHARDTAMALTGRLGPNTTLRSFDAVFGWRPPTP
ncbi:FAD-dependent monooxygenase [Sphaerisporangium aureirubrum]|uniref:FAD-dependent monooxygenase n=1 Tax=Sphaerisporangium aureirubrum TaxID=1544736 RepID=UPI003639D802